MLEKSVQIILIIKITISYKLIWKLLIIIIILKYTISIGKVSINKIINFNKKI